MKNYFTSLFDYDRYANKLILKVIMQAGELEKPVQLMAHLLSAQQVWYNRCKGLPPTGSVLWPDWKASTFKQLIDDNHGKWISFLNERDDSDLEKQITYQNSKGETFTDKLTEVLAHVINHGTHHRAQAGQHLKFAGESLPNTDYIFYLRSLRV
ncbi:MAG TPA: DinB family protein [Mucilaginibacter sp.]|jgi:uncharacterized damage-inducible protein DinB